MKSDTERTKRYQARLHERKVYLHVHLAKDLRQKLKIKKRALRVHKGDRVRVLRGVSQGKEGKVVRVNYHRSKIYIEGIQNRTARGKEVLVAFQPSNLLLLELETTPERQKNLGLKVSVKEKKVDEAVSLEPGAGSQRTGDAYGPQSTDQGAVTGTKAQAPEGSEPNAQSSMQ